VTDATSRSGVQPRRAGGSADRRRLRLAQRQTGIRPPSAGYDSPARSRPGVRTGRRPRAVAGEVSGRLGHSRCDGLSRFRLAERQVCVDPGGLRSRKPCALGAFASRVRGVYKTGRRRVVLVL